MGLLGPNGAGKTTLISHLSGALAVQSGEIRIDGQPLQQVRAKAPTRIAVAPQDQAFYPMLTVAENLACFAAAGGLSGARKKARIEACTRFLATRTVRGRARRAALGWPEAPAQPCDCTVAGA